MEPTADSWHRVRFESVQSLEDDIDLRSLARSRPHSLSKTSRGSPGVFNLKLLQNLWSQFSNRGMLLKHSFSWPRQPFSKRLVTS